MSSDPLTPIIDMDALRGATDGTEEDLISLVKLFREQMTQYLKNLQMHVETQSLEGIQKSAHKAAGSSAVCGMVPLCSALRKLQYLKEEELAQAASLFSDGLKEYQRVLEALELQFPTRP